MLILGTLLIIVALVVVAFMWWGTADLQAMPVDLGVFQATLTPLQIFLLGAGAVLVLSFGAALLSAGLARQRRKRREVKKLRKQVADGDSRPPSQQDAGGHREPRSGGGTYQDSAPHDQGGHRGPGSRDAGPTRGGDGEAGGRSPGSSDRTERLPQRSTETSRDVSTDDPGRTRPVPRQPPSDPQPPSR